MNKKLNMGQMFTYSALLLAAVIILLTAQWLTISALTDDPVAVFTPVSVISAVGLGTVFGLYLRKKAHASE